MVELLDLYLPMTEFVMGELSAGLKPQQLNNSKALYFDFPLSSFFNFSFLLLVVLKGRPDSLIRLSSY